MTPRTDFLAVLLRQQLRMDTERRAFAGQVSEATQRNGFLLWPSLRFGHPVVFEPLVWVWHELVMRDVDRVCDEWYGTYPGDPSARFLTLIVDECRRAKAVPIQRTLEDIQRRVPAPIWRVIQREAA